MLPVGDVVGRVGEGHADRDVSRERGDGGRVGAVAAEEPVFAQLPDVPTFRLRRAGRLFEGDVKIEVLGAGALLARIQGT